ncbi:hypothetical protein [Streptomyces sp. CA-179760]|uniref:hypothetical protein n=1 Tax=Streptomyces sp. CA-179760 TaxID=3240054 RepID=UPI003D90F50E
MTERPNAGSTRRPRRNRTLFAPEEAVHLSELSLPAGGYKAFSAGQRIAMVHWAGVTHGDLHEQHMLFNPFTGTTFVHDFGAGRLGDVEPDRMFQDLVTVRLTMSESWTRGFLAGYVKSSCMVIDPKYPGYTDALLARAGGRIMSVAKPAEPVLTDADCTALLAPALDLSSGFPRLTTDLPDDVVSPDDLAIVRCALLMAGVGGSARMLPESPLPGTVGLLLDTLATYKRDEHEPDLLFPGLAAWRWIHPYMDEPAVLRCMAGMIDVCDWLALRLDCLGTPSRPALINSVRAAQLSLMLLQHPSWPVSELEAQELKITSRHRHLSWYAPMLKTDPGDERYTQTVTYLMSRLTLYRKMFSEPSPATGKTSGRLWSANWRGLSLSRTALRNVLSALRSGTFAREPKMGAAQDVYMLSTHYTRAAHDNLTAAMAMQEPSDISVALVEDMEVAAEISEMSSIESTDLVGLAWSKRISDKSGDDFDKMVVRGINPDY